MLTAVTTGRSAVVGLLVGLVCVVLCCVIAAPPAAAVEAQGVRVDVDGSDLLGGGSVLRPAVPQGGQAVYRLRLRNQRDVPVEVVVYGADATGDGEVASGTDNQGVGAWITADQPRLEIPAEDIEGVEVTIARPAGAAEGGFGAIVVQLSDATRRQLDLEQVQRAALLVEVADDGSGDGVLAEVLDTDTSAGLVPGVLTVQVRYADTGALDDLEFDGSVVLARPFGDAPTYDAETGELFPGGDVTATVEVELPWYGLVGTVRAEAAMPGLTTRSAPAQVVVLPPWFALLLVVLAGAVLLHAHRTSDTGLDLRGLLPWGGDGAGDVAQDGADGGEPGR